MLGVEALLSTGDEHRRVGADSYAKQVSIDQTPGPVGAHSTKVDSPLRVRASTTISTGAHTMFASESYPSASIFITALMLPLTTT